MYDSILLEHVDHVVLLTPFLLVLDDHHHRLPVHGIGVERFGIYRMGA